MLKVFLNMLVESISEFRAVASKQIDQVQLSFLANKADEPECKELLAHCCPDHGQLGAWIDRLIAGELEVWVSLFRSLKEARGIGIGEEISNLRRLAPSQICFTFPENMEVTREMELRVQSHLDVMAESVRGAIGSQFPCHTIVNDSALARSQQGTILISLATSAESEIAAITSRLDSLRAILCHALGFRENGEWIRIEILEGAEPPFVPDPPVQSQKLTYVI